ncbi:MAG: acyltransferase [Clostridium sp.]|nr:acyltransferase [Prevotella sp.]MCM1428856.1 acyltransferase [Clostridium sp.]MCM1475231.1 acyltransferase [Muribaculaceae bacterium]
MLNLFKTIYYNFHFFGIQGLLHLPILVHSHVVFRDISGKIKVNGNLRKGLIRFGSNQPLATRDMQYERTIIDITGELIISGNIHIAPGSRISINENARLLLGKNFNTTGNVTIICDKEINIGDNCLFSWDIQIMDADFHKINNVNGKCINLPRAIEVGDNVWVCSKTIILKGTRIANGCVIGAGSVLTKQFNEENCIIAGNGNNCSIVRREISWER